jgi:hypothetical protein
MSAYVERLVERLRDAEDDLKRDVGEQHRYRRQSIPACILEGHFLSLLTAPISYSLLRPFVLLDSSVTLSQWVCFPIYGVALVRRRRYFSIDRHKLALAPKNGTSSFQTAPLTIHSR